MGTVVSVGELGDTFADRGLRPAHWAASAAQLSSYIQPCRMRGWVARGRPSGSKREESMQAQPRKAKTHDDARGAHRGRAGRAGDLHGVYICDLMTTE